MSAVYGIVNFDGAPVDSIQLQRMAGTPDWWVSDGINYQVDRNVGFAHLPFNTTPESHNEHQPLYDSTNTLLITADVRVDNRTDLIKILKAKSHLAGVDNPTDVELLLAAYRCWGKEFPKNVIGDFAFALWDKQEQTLLLARDPLGIRPIFYYWQGQTFFFASTLSSIVAGLKNRPPINDSLIVDFLCHRFDRWVTETAYQSIMRLPGSHVLQVSGGSAEPHQYWTFGAQDGPRFKKESDYWEQFRDLFQEAISCRLRSSTPVGISVSGGLDSSSIASMAHYFLTDNGRHESLLPLRLYSFVFSDRFPAANEKIFLDAVRDKCLHFPAISVTEEHIWGLKDQLTGYLDEPEIYPIRSLLLAIMQAAKNDGCRVVLTGEGGDQVLNVSAYAHPDFLFDLPLRRYKNELPYFWQRHNRWSFLPKLIGNIVKPFVKPWLPPAIAQQKYLYGKSAAPNWIKEEWLVNSQHLAASSSIKSNANLQSRSANHIHRRLTGGWYVALLGYIASLTAMAGVEYRHPFLDRRLVEYQLSTPPQLHFSDGRTKMMLRKSLNGILPNAVQCRTSFAHFTEVAEYGLCTKEKQQIDNLFEEAAKVQEKYIDANLFNLTWQEYCAGDKSSRRFLLALLFLHLWQQSTQ
jgi:asparagine synthase (glutamine-hydrolysing)